MPSRKGLFRKIVRVTIFLILAVLAAGKVPTILEGYLLWPGLLGTCAVVAAGLAGLIYLQILGVVKLLWPNRYRFWNRKTAIALLLVLWALPIPGYSPWTARFVGYSIRVKLLADIPAILAWADSYSPPQPTSAADHYVPPEDLPVQVRTLGMRAFVHPETRRVMIVNGAGFFGHWGVSVGHGIGGEGGRWRISDDAYVWEGE